MALISSVAATGATAGCLSDERAAMESIVEVIEDEEIDVEDYGVEDDYCYIEYLNSRGNEYEIGTVASAYAGGAADADLGFLFGECYRRQAPDVLMYDFVVEEKWAEAWYNDEITTDEYRSRVMEEVVEY